MYSLLVGHLRANGIGKILQVQNYGFGSIVDDRSSCPQRARCAYPAALLRRLLSTTERLHCCNERMKVFIYLDF